MSVNSGQESTGTPLERTNTRLWVRRDELVTPFLWRGFWPALGLVLVGIFAVGPFAQRAIQARVAAQVRANLEGHGMQWVRIDAISGQDLRLSGVQPAPGAGPAALALARSTRCPTWAGELVCALTISGEFAQPAPLVAPPPPIVPAPTGNPPAAAQAPASAAHCARSLASIVARKRIEFASGSARIQVGSSPVLDALASASQSCPGVIRVAGYTDASGSAAANRKLSTARAAAVRSALIERGVAPARVQSVGFGAVHPIASNRSAAGRARNRRIEFQVL